MIRNAVQWSAIRRNKSTKGKYLQAEMPIYTQEVVIAGLSDDRTVRDLDLSKLSQERLGGFLRERRRMGGSGEGVPPTQAAQLTPRRANSCKQK
jgi:hypothetical protein